MNEIVSNQTGMPPDLDRLSASDFLPLQGQEFTIRFEVEVHAVAMLEQVLQLPGYSNLERNPFSILLQTGLKTRHYPQAIYEVEHDALGQLAIFLVPVGPTAKGMQYEAVFS